MEVSTIIDNAKESQDMLLNHFNQTLKRFIIPTADSISVFSLVFYPSIISALCLDYASQLVLLQMSFSRSRRIMAYHQRNCRIPLMGLTSLVFLAIDDQI